MPHLLVIACSLSKCKVDVVGTSRQSRDSRPMHQQSIPEGGINVSHLESDIRWLSDSFAKDHGARRAGKIVLRNEYANATYTTQVIAMSVQAMNSHNARL
jgi:hypothetical protein